MTGPSRQREREGEREGDRIRGQSGFLLAVLQRAGCGSFERATVWPSISNATGHRATQ